MREGFLPNFGCRDRYGRRRGRGSRRRFEGPVPHRLWLVQELGYLNCRPEVWYHNRAERGHI